MESVNAPQDARSHADGWACKRQLLVELRGRDWIAPRISMWSMRHSIGDSNNLKYIYYIEKTLELQSGNHCVQIKKRHANVVLTDSKTHRKIETIVCGDFCAECDIRLGEAPLKSALATGSKEKITVPRSRCGASAC